MKAEIKKRYLAALPVTYPQVDYSEGSRAMELAGVAADRALSGDIALAGGCWIDAVRSVTGWKRWTRSLLSGLPE